MKDLYINPVSDFSSFALLFLLYFLLPVHILPAKSPFSTSQVYLSKNYLKIRPLIFISPLPVSAPPAHPVILTEICRTKSSAPTISRPPTFRWFFVSWSRVVVKETFLTFLYSSNLPSSQITAPFASST